MNPKKIYRIAAIDIGTNSFHLIIVEMLNDGSFKLLDRNREVLRLGSEKGKDLSLISETETKRAIKVLSSFSNLAKYHQATVRAISTSTVREAKNQKEFIDAVYKKTGIDIEVVDGKKEAELIFLGIKKALPINNKNVLCMDIGGGSTELIYAQNGISIFAESIKIGAVRLSKMFFPDYIITDSAIKSCSDYVEKQIMANKNINVNIDFDFAAGVSGTIDTIFYLSQFSRYKKVKDALNGFSFTKQEFEDVYELIIKLKTPAERVLIQGMETKRADIIPGGIIILKKIFELFKINKMVISEYALREGIVFDTYEKLKK